MSSSGLSGAQKRKLKKEQVEKMKKLPKIDKYIKVTALPVPSSSSEVEVMQKKTAAGNESGIDNSVSNQTEKDEVNTSKQSEPIQYDRSCLPLNINNDELKLKILKHGPIQPLGPYPKDLVSNRSFTNAYFTVTTKTGQEMKRTWLCYSMAMNAVYCQPCWLFANRHDRSYKTAWCEGIRDWKGLSKKLKEHEKSLIHVNACVTYDLWKRKNTIMEKLNDDGGSADKLKDILKRYIDVILTLAVCNLPLRGHAETAQSDAIGSSEGNFLSIIRLLRKYDPVLSSHLESEKKSWYLSPKIQNEIIQLLATNVKSEILKEIKESPFFSVIMDTTQDLSKIDQLSQVIRYVSIKHELGQATEICVKESFLGFKDIQGQSARELEEEILMFLNNCGLDLSKCRGQGYDGASNMSGIYSGVQQRIKQREPTAEYVHCANHNLNLVLNDSCNGVVEIKEFYVLLQEIYKFFGCSIKRWQTISALQKEEGIKKTLKTVHHKVVISL